MMGSQGPLTDVLSYQLNMTQSLLREIQKLDERFLYRVTEDTYLV